MPLSKLICSLILLSLSGRSQSKPETVDSDAAVVNILNLVSIEPDTCYDWATPWTHKPNPNHTQMCLTAGSWCYWMRPTFQITGLKNPSTLIDTILGNAGGCADLFEQKSLKLEKGGCGQSIGFDQGRCWHDEISNTSDPSKSRTVLICCCKGPKCNALAQPDYAQINGYPYSSLMPHSKYTPILPKCAAENLTVCGDKLDAPGVCVWDNHRSKSNRERLFECVTSGSEVAELCPIKPHNAHDWITVADYNNTEDKNTLCRILRGNRTTCCCRATLCDPSVLKRIPNNPLLATPQDVSTTTTEPEHKDTSKTWILATILTAAAAVLLGVVVLILLKYYCKLRKEVASTKLEADKASSDEDKEKEPLKKPDKVKADKKK